MRNGAVVLGEGFVGAGGVGVGQFEGGLEDLDLAEVLGVDAGLATLVVAEGEVLDLREGAGGAALVTQILLDAE